MRRRESQSFGTPVGPRWLVKNMKESSHRFSHGSALPDKGALGALVARNEDLSERVPS